jgi:chitin disaccharide deacetylase
MIVTADDFGLCPEIDEAICLLHDRGVVGRTSLVVNGPSFEASVEALRQRPALQVAIHLNITDGAPVLPAAQVASLVDREGRFRGGRHYGIIAGILGGRIRTSEIGREWRAQIARARDAGIGLCEMNAHGHLHLLPPLHGIVLGLRREFGIPGVRLVRSSEGARGMLLHLCSHLLLRKLRGEGEPATLPDRTLGLRRPGSIDLRIRLRELADDAGGRIELIVHPARRPNPYHQRWGYSGEQVFNWLLADLSRGAE